MRHDRGAENPDRDVELVPIEDDGRAGHEPAEDRAQFGAADDDLEQEAEPHRSDQHHHEGLDQPKAFVLEVEKQQDVERGDPDTPR